MEVTALFAGILGLIFFGLTIRIIYIRRTNKIALGDGGHQSLAKAIRAHSNFIEYVPIVLVLFTLLEFRGAEDFLLYCLGTLLVIGRLLHAYGISQVDENYRYRVSGMVLTNIVLVSASLRLLAGLFG